MQYLRRRLQSVRTQRRSSFGFPTSSLRLRRVWRPRHIVLAASTRTNHI